MDITINLEFAPDVHGVCDAVLKVWTKDKIGVAAQGVTGLVAPHLGEYWPTQGGHFVGTVYDPDGKHYHLIVGPEMEGEEKWQKSLDWAKALTVDGHSDFNLPNQREGRFLQCNGKQFFKDAWYWLSAQYAGNSLTAWAQDFDHGFQDTWRKGTDFRARAVRRLFI